MKYYTITHLKGDTFQGATVTLTEEQGESIDITNASLKMQMRYNSKDGTVAKTFVNGNGMTIIDSLTFQIDPQVINVAAGTYYSDVQITLSATEVYSPISIKWIIYQDATV